MRNSATGTHQYFNCRNQQVCTIENVVAPLAITNNYRIINSLLYCSEPYQSMENESRQFIRTGQIAGHKPNTETDLTLIGTVCDPR